ncbi:MAG: hypothetical protein PVF27_05585 [Gemmatimonadales bacterium]|jgi:hypothetical protein
MTLGIDPHALARLVQAALTAPDDVHELRTDTGVVIKLERGPEPGVEYRLFVPEQADWEVLLVAAVDDRPTRYPSGLPFVPGASAVVARGEGQQTVTWHQEGDVGAFRELMAESDALADDPAIKRAQERVRPLLERAREGEAEARAALQDEAAMIRAATSAERRARMRQIWERLQPGPERLIELERIFRSAIEATERAGWERVGSSDPADGVFHARSATYRRGDVERTFTMAVGFGPISSVMVWERGVG